MIDMKIPKKKIKNGCQPVAVTSGYPYGLKLNLENEQIKKLGLDIEDLKIGQKVMVIGEAEISNISSYTESDGRKNLSIGLQIMKMDKLSPVVTMKNRVSKATIHLKKIRKEY